MQANTTGRPFPLCPACGGVMINVLYVCRGCWFLLPGNERAAVMAMHRKCENMASKIEKCVRIIKAKRSVTELAEPSAGASQCDGAARQSEGPVTP